MRTLLVPLALIGSLACNKGESNPEDASGVGQRTSDTPDPSPQMPRGGQLARDFGVTLNGDIRTIPGHAPEAPAWIDRFRERIHAEGDDSEREKVAVRFEGVCVELFAALLGREQEQAAAFLADNFAGFTNLSAEFGSARFADGTFQVFDAVLSETAPQPLTQTLDHWDGWQDASVTASVVAIEPQDAGGWKCHVELRIVGDQSGHPAMLDIEFDADLAPNGPLPSITGLEATSQRLIRRQAPAFQSISGDVFGSLANWDRELGLGSEDYDRKLDRAQVSFGTGILGMALGDVNGDGLEDIYLSAIGGFPNRLLLHQPDGSVVDGAHAAGVDVLDTTRGALLVDLDGDMDLDLCIARTAEVVLFWNDGKGKFDRAQVLDGPGTSPIYSISAADPDSDGDLDLFASRYSVDAGNEGVPTPYHDAQNGAMNLFWRNDGEHVFTLAGEETGLASGVPRFSFVSLWDDFDGDGQIDLYVVNDFGPNNLYINDNGHFTDMASSLGMIDRAAGMGISVADVELDGDLDVYVTNMYSAPGLRATAEPGYRAGDVAGRAMHRRLAEGNSLLLQGEPGKYTEQAIRAGVDHGGWAWGAIFYDWNLDGLPDLYVPNGFVTAAKEEDVESLFWRWIVRVTPPPAETASDYYRNWGALSAFNRVEGYSYNGFERNFAYLNLGAAEFADVSPLTAMDFIDDGRVASRVDWDGDGYEDLLLINRTGPRLRLVRNAQVNSGHRIVLELIGKQGPAGAVGARVRVIRGDGKVVIRTVYAGEGLLGQSSTRLFFGLAGNADPVRVEIRWPDGEKQEFEELAADRGWKLHQDGKRVERAFTKSPFEGREATPVPANTRGAERCALAAKVPLRQLSFSKPGGGKRKLGELGKARKLVTFWDPETRSGEAFLRQLSAIKKRITNTGAVIVPVALDGESDGRALLGELGLGEHALTATPTDLLVIETLLIEVLGTYDEIPLPLSFLLDGDSHLVALYYGEVRNRELMGDLRRLRSKPAEMDSTLALSGGYWLAQPKRRYDQVIRALQMLGSRDLAKDLKKQ